ncbi:tyrosine-type recombinase/integrase [Mumia sp. DW29H23]|uniref:tyrosine-type recombinase/integrase n=1 Tax=Mumia sp. DW29H23 TaxID=3421241 RepID=UPI003D68A4E3
MASPEHRVHEASGTESWRVRFRIGGKQRSETFYAESTAEEFAALVNTLGAERALAYWLRETADPATPTLDQWADRYLAALTGVTDGTRRTYARMYRKVWSPLLGSYPLDAISRETIQLAIAKLDPDWSDKTIRNHHGLLASMMNGAVVDKLIAGSPCKGVRLPRRTEHTVVEMRFLDHGEFDRLLGEVPAHYQPLVLTLAGTGMRWGEAEALEVADVDLAKRTVRITKAAKWDGSKAARDVGPTKTRRSRRTITLPPQVVAALAPLVSGRSKSDRLFLAPRGGPLRHRTFYDDWKPAVERAGLDPQPRIHDLRHTHVAWLIAQGVSLPVIQARLGHESITTTIDRYGHLLPDLQRAAADAAEAALAGVSLSAIEA